MDGWVYDGWTMRMCMHGIDSICFSSLYGFLTVEDGVLCSMAFAVVCFLDTTLHPLTLSWFCRRLGSVHGGVHGVHVFSPELHVNQIRRSFFHGTDSIFIMFKSMHNCDTLIIGIIPTYYLVSIYYLQS